MIRLWDSQGNPVGNPLEAHAGGVYPVAISSDGQTIVSGGFDGTVRLWGSQGSPVGNPLEGHTDRVYSVVISPDG